MRARSLSEKSYRSFLCSLPVVIVLVALAVRNGFCRQVSLNWEPSQGAGVAGYKVYYGTSPGSYTDSIDLGKSTSCTISGLEEGPMYHFATTSYDSMGRETAFKELTSPMGEPTGDGACVISLSREAVAVGAYGGSGRIDVVTGRPCDWKAASEAVPWLSVRNEGPKSLHYDVAPNQGGARTAGVTVGGKVLIVTQAGSREAADAAKAR